MLRFLHEARLIEKNNCIVSLFRAELDKADLSDADLSGADLKGAFLRETDLKGTNLSDADLSGANLKDATGITSDELERQTTFLKGAIMPDGTKHP